MSGGKQNASRVAIATVAGLVILKVVVGVWTGSLSVIAQAADSFLDLFSVIIMAVGLAVASRPADRKHPFGHGKAENVAAIIQALLIFIAAGAIIYSAVNRALAGTAPEMTEAGIAVMIVSIFASIYLSRYLRKAAREQDSVTLQATASNINADIYSALAVLAGLIAVRLTGLGIIDAILGGVVALFILKIGYDVIRVAFGDIIDVKLPEEEEKIIREALNEHRGMEIIGFHKLRTRKSGSRRYIDLHLVMPWNSSLKTSHELTDHLEKDIKAKLGLSDVTIHIEPCDENCSACDIVNCSERKN